MRSGAHRIWLQSAHKRADGLLQWGCFTSALARSLSNFPRPLRLFAVWTLFSILCKVGGILPPGIHFSTAECLSIVVSI